MMGQIPQDQTPLITTIIPTYRRPQMLRKAVRSVLSQTFEDFQVAIYDNASGDETAEVVAELQQEDSRVKYFCHPENIGMIPNFNYAMERVTTPFFSFLPDDDLLLPCFYTTALSGFERFPNAASSSGTIILTDLDGLLARQGPCIPEGEYFTPPEGMLAWRNATKPLIIANMFRREVIPHLGSFVEKECMDAEWEMRLVAQFPFVVSCQPCALVTIHKDHWGQQFQTRADLWWENYMMIEKSVRGIKGLPPSIADAALDTLKRDYGNFVYWVGLVSVSNGKTQQAHAIVSVLHDCYGMPKEAAHLKRIATLTDHFGFLQHPFQFYRHVRKVMQMRKTRDLRAKLHQYREAPYKEFQL